MKLFLRDKMKIVKSSVKTVDKFIVFSLFFLAFIYISPSIEFIFFYLFKTKKRSEISLNTFGGFHHKFVKQTNAFFSRVVSKEKYFQDKNENSIKFLIFFHTFPKLFLELFLPYQQSKFSTRKFLFDNQRNIAINEWNN